MKITTKDAAGNPNGWLIPIWNVLDEPGLRPEQVYVTAVAPRARKGPHQHNFRRGVFHCISGEVTVRRRVMPGQYVDTVLKPGEEYVFVGRCTAAAIYNFGDSESIILNMPNPAYDKNAPDDVPVTDWVDPAGWPPEEPEPECDHICGVDW